MCASMQPPTGAGAAPSLSEDYLQSLSAAAHTIEAQLSKDDHFPELWNIVATSRASGEYLRELKSQFHQKRIITLPPALLEQFESILHATAFGKP